MREAFTQELGNLLGQTQHMLTTVGRMVPHARSALLNRQVHELEQLQDLDREVDTLEHRIEHDALRVIALQQPVARDLRFVGMVLKSLADIERMGDYLVHVGKDSVALAEQPQLKRYINLGRMLERIAEMVPVLNEALADQDADKARRVIEMDDEIDDLYEQIQRELVTYMLEDPRTISVALRLMKVGRSLERVGDHIENVAERVIFWAEGELPAKHENPGDEDHSQPD